MIQKYSYRGDENIGFFATVVGDTAVVAPEFDQFFDEQVETYAGRTRLLGLYTAGNSSCLLVPDVMTDHELEGLDVEVEVVEIDSRRNALGNMILCNDKGALVSPRLEERKEEIAEALGVEVKVGKIAGLPNPGVCGVSNGKGAVIHREASEEEAEKVKEVLQVNSVAIGTVNMGSPYIGSGILCSEEKMLVGENTTGPEIGRFDTTLL